MKKSRNRDKELEELKREIEKLVGKTEIEKITRIVEMRFKMK